MLLLLLLLLPWLAWGPVAARGRADGLLPLAHIWIDATRPGVIIDGRLWGSNQGEDTQAPDTVENPDFIDKTRQMAVHFIRWPGGNNASAYDWKNDVAIRPGKRQARPDNVDISRILPFVQAIDGELGITVNFGTMNAQDAADLVEFLNGPADSEWGARRAELGFPEPLNVRYFEIGNEENQPHMWYYSWTAENPEKYFYGGEEERRGRYDNTSSQEYDPVGAKGDFFKVGAAEEQIYYLRFVPVRDVQVFWAASAEDARQQIFETWQQVDDLSGYGPDDRVYTLDAEKGILRFGDGVHGMRPPAGSYFLAEYTTYGHDGFLAFAQAMRAAPSSVPIRIGSVMLPFEEGRPLFDENSMREILSEMDFYVRHQYNASFDYQTYDARRQIASERASHLEQTRLRDYMQSIGIDREIGIAVTEWNIFLDKDYWWINRTLEGGVIAAEWFARVLNLIGDTPLYNAAQFALSGGELALIRTQSNDSISPMGYVFQGFAEWPGSRVLPVEVDSPAALAADQEVPYVVAAAAISADEQTLRLVVVNNAREQIIRTSLTISGFTPSSARLWRLASERYQDDNDRDPYKVVLQEEPLTVVPTTLDLPPHSVSFLSFAAAARSHAYFPMLLRNGKWPLPTHTPSPTPTPTIGLTEVPSPTPTSTPSPTS
ncbi:MAG: hypothetical protein D6775_11845, partial [Caldilineae bacterium]